MVDYNREGMFKNTIKKAVRYYFMNKRRTAYMNLYKKTYKENKTFDLQRKLPEDIERKWLDKYKNYDKNVSVESLRIYSNYLKEEDYNYIIPYETFSLYISPILSPVKLAHFYNDKNNLNLMLDKEYLAPTVFRRIDGVYKDADYRIVNFDNDNSLYAFLDKKGITRLIIKPSRATFGGFGISKIFKSEGTWYVNAKQKLTLDFIETFSENFIVQECILQSAFTKQFNKSSVNTLRMFTYKSVVNDEIDVLCLLLRIGKSGNVADNIALGGQCVKILEDGKLYNEYFDNYGNITDRFNNIDLKNNNFVLPNYENIISFGKIVASKFPYHNALALDIALDENNTPRLVEINFDALSIEMLYFAHIPLFGKYTDEVLQYSSKYTNTFVSLSF